MSASAHGASSASSNKEQQRAISEEQLLAFIDEKRARPRANANSSTTGRDRSKQTKDPTDSGNSLDTLDLCHKRIERVPDSLVDTIKHQVVRLALGYNHITRLPASFADLSSLRYLNIRANNFATFPECVTKMPNLEILDLSRNKIRKLPQEPGRLLALRVLSMNANRLTELPAWVGKMKHLRILKLDNNPLEWPPPHISKMPNVAPPKAPSSSSGSAAAEREKAKRFEDRQMLVWISKLRSWVNDPANQPQTDASEQALASSAHDTAALARQDSGADFAGPARADDVGLSSEPSDGLISLQVHVPETVQDQTRLPNTVEANMALQTSVTAASSIAAKATSMVGRAVAVAGLLPPLVPQSSSSANGLDANMDRTASGTSSTFQPSMITPSPHQETVRGVAIQPRATQAIRQGVALPPNGMITSQFTPDDMDSRQHARNNSHSVVQDIATTHQMEGRRSLKSKKSLPDLRKSHEDILQERRDVLAEQLPETKTSDASAQDADEGSRDIANAIVASGAVPARAPFSQAQEPAKQFYARKPLLQARRAPRPSLGNVMGISARQGHEGAASGSTTPSYGTSLGAAQPGIGSSQVGGLRKLSLPTVGATQAAAEAAAAALAARAGYSNTPPRFDVGHGRMASDRGDGNWPSRSASPTVNGARNAADQERNSYFRRLSTLPPSTISKAVPVPVLKFVDGTRGVLFALSQIHAAIGQFMTPVIDERISSQFHRLLDISNGSVTNLINALDRFDSLSRRGTPDASVIRGVLVTCKDSVITFRKLISVLQLQLRALQSSSDVRYARTLLLMLYGSMAEVSNSWTEMAPLVEEVQPYLTQTEQDVGSPASSDIATAANASTEKSTPSTRVGSLAQKSISTTSNGSASTLPSIAEASTPVRAGSRPYLARGPSRRRHAGSFSAQDLAQGAAMTPSASNQPPFNLEDLQATSAYNTPARGARNRRQGSMGNSASSATTFAPSDSSERSTTVDGTIQSTAPSTPGGASVVTASQRSIYATPDAMSTPTSSRQKRSGSNASSAMEAAPSGAANTPRSQATTPATPAATADKRHAASQSTGTGGGATAATAAAGSRLHAAVSDPKISVDDHLLEMVDNITKLSARVWSMLFEHLRSAGVDDKSADAAAAEALDVEGKDASSPARDEIGESGQQPSSEAESGGNGSEGKPGMESKAIADKASTQRLRDLRDLALITDDLTSQLRLTYLRAREEEQRRTSLDGNRCGEDDTLASLSAAEPDVVADAATDDIAAISANSRTAPIIATPSPDNISQATVAKLFDESHQFVRAIVNTSTLIKSISVSHEFPRDLRRLLGQVAQACSNLTVYLLWLSPTSVS
ncbi:hypothetical protein NDA16_000264 [Ustilago loliicola]|nr:hypothetical protein NDA16_000264 [Ustilago loliicola]